MKLYFAVGKSIDGYVNIDPSIHKISLSNLDSICEPAECTEIILHDFLNYIDYNSIGMALQNIVKLLRHNAAMTIIFHDVNHITRMFYNKSISIQDLNDVLFGNSSNSIRKQSVLTTQVVTDLLIQQGLQIITTSIDDNTVTIQARRP
jgi:hypothetical protein